VAAELCGGVPFRLRRHAKLSGFVFGGGLYGRFFERSHMYAVIKTGGKQYKVAAGEKIKVEQIAADVGQDITIEQVLAVGNGADLKVGSPWVAGASVTATVVAHGKHDKVRIFKMRRRKHYQKHGGHRQTYTEIQIGSVNA
jgi:large subunit ribosomal protein L21